MTDNHKSATEELIRIGVLDIADLEINRLGHLSPRQKRPLYLNFAFWLILASFDMIILVFFIYFQINFERNFITEIIWSGLIIVPAYACITNAKPYWKDIRDDKPSSISGKIYKRFSTGPNIGAKGFSTGYCSIGIGDQTFSISPLIYDHIINEEHYRVYFVSNSRKLINIEPL